MIEAYYLIGIAIGIMIGLIVGVVVTILVMLYRNHAETKAAYYYGLLEGKSRVHLTYDGKTDEFYDDTDWLIDDGVLRNNGRTQTAQDG